jgi:hypothetical protein
MDIAAERKGPLESEARSESCKLPDSADASQFSPHAATVLGIVVERMKCYG